VDDLVVDLFTSMVVTAIYLRLEGEAGPDVGARVAEHQLRWLGVSPTRAGVARWCEPWGRWPIFGAKSPGSHARISNGACATVSSS
jgi:hypothetical protein